MGNTMKNTSGSRNLSRSPRASVYYDPSRYAPSKRFSYFNNTIDPVLEEETSSLGLADIDEETHNIIEESTYSITLPSAFDNQPSMDTFAESSEDSLSHIYTCDRINTIMYRYIEIHGEELTEDMIGTTDTLLNEFEDLIKTSGIECLRKEVDISLQKKFVDNSNVRSEKAIYQSSHERLDRHMINVIILHRMLLEEFKVDLDGAYDMLQQLAVSHALMWVSARDFEVMNIVLGKFFLKYSLMHDENMSQLVTYFNKMTNFITSVYETQQIKYADVSHKTGRHSRPRQNYRIMKRWRVTVEEVHKRYENFIRSYTVAGSQVSKYFEEEEEDDTTIPTEILKERDWCMTKITKYLRIKKKSGNILPTDANKSMK